MSIELSYFLTYDNIFRICVLISLDKLSQEIEKSNIMLDGKEFIIRNTFYLTKIALSK